LTLVGESETPVARLGIIEMDFKAGDVVRLQSGGSQMTVQNVDGDRISCIWWENGDGIQRHTFPAICLEKIRSVEED
jgi:uncharacterized protein YodC (DUF2158 family)